MPGFPTRCQWLREALLDGGPTRNAGGDDNNVSAGEGVLETIVLGQVASDDLAVLSSTPVRRQRLVRTALEEMCDRSAATPGVLTTS